MAIKGLGWTFDIVAEQYDMWRPTYVPELFNDIFEYSNISSKSCALEIGIGTGQATKPILEKGCNIMAVEIGKNLTELTRHKFKDYSNISIVNSSFQSYVCENDSFDLVYSASAFHWIDEEEGYCKVHDILKSNGTFARFASHPFYCFEGQEELADRIQYVYFRHYPNPTGATSPKPIGRYTEEDAKRRSDIAKKYGFVDIETKVYYRDLIYRSDEYINRLAIESDKIALESHVRNQFLKDIKDVVDEYGGKITIRDMIDLNLARKL